MFNAMDHEFAHLNKKEAMQAENDFLKMKMMLENGAVFGSPGNPDLSPELENHFLKHVMAFEKQFENPKTIRLFDKIDQPTIFSPAAEINDVEISSALDALISWLSEYSITVVVHSPRVSVRELYRFITEELFEYEMENIDLPRYTTTFTYDDFHPDPVYECSEIAEDSIRLILDTRQLKFIPYLSSNELRLNDHYPLTDEDFIKLINRLKINYDEIKCPGISDVKCDLGATTARVTGNYAALLTTMRDEYPCGGAWAVDLESFDGMYWSITGIMIGNLRF